MGKAKVIKATFWYTICSFMLKGMGFITNPIFARILTKEEYGIYSNIMTWYGIIAIISTLSLSASLVRARFDFESDLESYVSSNLILGSVATVVVSCIILLNKSFFCELFVVDEIYLYIICGCILLNPAYDMFLSIERFKYKYKLVTLLTFFLAIVGTVLSLLLIMFMEDHLLARVLGTYIPTFLVSLVIYAYFLLKGHNIKIEHCKYSLAIAIPYVFHLLAGTILNSSDKTMITNMAGTEANALYSMSYLISMIVSTLWMSIDKAFAPWLGEKLHERNYSSIKKYSSIYAFIFGYIVFGMMLLGPEVLYMQGGEAYMEAKYVIPPVMVGYMFIMIYALYVNIEQYEKKTLGMAISTVLAAVINVGSNAVLIPLFGYIAAAYTTLACDILMVVFHYLLVRRMGMSNIYDTKKLLLISLIMFVSVPTCELLYQVFFARMLVVLIYIAILAIYTYKNRQMILEYYHKRRGNLGD